MPAQGTATGSVYTPPRRRARRTAARGVATPIPAASSSAASTGGFAGTHAASVGSASYHPAVALAASHSGAVLARVMHGLDPALRSLLPSAVALAHHENLPASLLVGIAQANGTAHTKGLVNVARRLKANDFHAAPHAALEKVTGNVAGALKAAQQLHPLDKVPNPHMAHPGPTAVRAPMGADASLRRTVARVAPPSRRPPALTGGTAPPREVGIGRAPKQKLPKAAKATRRAVRAVAGLGPEAAVLARTDIRLAKRFGIPASVLFNQQGIESGFGANTTGPPTPYGAARGEAQFIKGTRDSILQKYGVDAWAGPRQAAKAQALLLRDSGYAKSPQQAVYSYNHSTAYVNDVLSGAKQYKVLDKIAAGHGSPYVYPFDPHKIQVGRIDQGQDFSGGGPIRAIGRARYIGQGQGPAWASGGGGGTGQGLLYKLTRGPQKGRYVFVYEGIATKAGLTPGQKLHKGQVIGKVLPSPASLEIGFADSSGTPISHATYVEGQETQGGKAMARFLSTIKSGGGIPIGGFGPSSGGFVGLSGSAPATSGVAAQTMGAFSGPAAHQGRGGGGGAGSLTPQLAALLPENFRAGAAAPQSALADQLRSEARPKRRLTTGR